MYRVNFKEIYKFREQRFWFPDYNISLLFID